jgi:hypothetical protein
VSTSHVEHSCDEDTLGSQVSGVPAKHRKYGTGRNVVDGISKEDYIVFLGRAESKYIRVKTLIMNGTTRLDSSGTRLLHRDVGNIHPGVTTVGLWREFQSSRSWTAPQVQNRFIVRLALNVHVYGVVSSGLEAGPTSG